MPAERGDVSALEAGAPVWLCCVQLLRGVHQASLNRDQALHGCPAGLVWQACANCTALQVHGVVAWLPDPAGTSVYVHPVLTLRLLHAASSWPSRAVLQFGPSAEKCCAAVCALRHDAGQLH